MKTEIRIGWFRTVAKADAMASHLFKRGYVTVIAPYGGGGAQLNFWKKSK